MVEKLKALTLGYAGAIIGALCMLVLGIFGKIGLYSVAVEEMTKWHMFFSLSITGIIFGMIEAAVWAFIMLYLFGLLYNKLR